MHLTPKHFGSIAKINAWRNGILDHGLSRANKAIKRPVRSVLIILTKPLGDQIIASALILNLRAHYPRVKIVMFTAKSHAKFLLAHRIADEVIFPAERRGHKASFAETVLPRKAAEFFELLRRMRRARFDMTIDLTDRKTSRFLVGLINAPIRVGYTPPELPLGRFERQPANFFARPFGYDGKHYLHRYLAPLEALGLPLVHHWPAIGPLSCELARARALLQAHQVEPGRFVVVHLGSSYIGRTWQPERFAQTMNAVADEIGMPFVLIGGREETLLGDAVALSTTCRIINLIGKLKLETLLAILKDAHMFLGNDSGPMHMAAAVGTPVVALFGMTSPERWGPVGVPHVTVRVPMPCQCIDRVICQFPDTTKVCCIWRISVDDVVTAIRDLLPRIDTKAVSPPESDQQKSERQQGVHLINGSS